MHSKCGSFATQKLVDNSTERCYTVNTKKLLRNLNKGNIMSYTVAEVTIPTAGIFYTARNDNRTPEQVVADGISGFANGIQSDVYTELNSVQKCSVQDIFTGLSKEEAEAKKKTLIEFGRVKGFKVLNAR
jgi:hypothetical protein